MPSTSSASTGDRGGTEISTIRTSTTSSAAMTSTLSQSAPSCTTPIHAALSSIDSAASHPVRR